jgi:hypothetical protein
MRNQIGDGKQRGRKVNVESEHVILPFSFRFSILDSTFTRNSRKKGELKLKPIQVTQEIGRCSVCKRLLKRFEFYYDLSGLWVHVKCFKEYPIIPNER